MGNRSFGNYRSSVGKWSPPAHDEGERRVIGQGTPPPVEWDRAYGDDDITLAQEATALLAEGMSPGAAAQELVRRYGRQVLTSGEALATEVRDERPQP